MWFQDLLGFSKGEFDDMPTEEENVISGIFRDDCRLVNIFEIISAVSYFKQALRLRKHCLSKIYGGGGGGEFDRTTPINPGSALSGDEFPNDESARKN